MATSSSYDFSLNRDEIIRRALVAIGRAKPNTNPPTDWVTDAAEVLNVMMKAWQSQSIGLWLLKNLTVFLQYNTESFDIGPSGDHATLSYAETTLDDDEEEDDTSIVVASATGIADTYAIGVEVDDGTIHWTTVNGTPSGTTVTLTTGLDDDAADGNAVFCYETLPQRPLELYDARIRNSSGEETPVSIVSREEYFAMSDKDALGTPNIVYYDPQLTNGKLYLWPTNSDASQVLRLTAKYPLEDFDAAANDADFPVEWTEPLIYNLALRLFVGHADDVATDRIPLIRKLAEDSLKQVQSFDAEHTSIYFKPNLRGY